VVEKLRREIHLQLPVSVLPKVMFQLVFFMPMSLILPVGAADSECLTKKSKAAGKKKATSKVEDYDNMDKSDEGSEEDKNDNKKSDPDETEEDYEDQ
jgi:hypothetical protein